VCISICHQLNMVSTGKYCSNESIKGFLLQDSYQGQYFTEVLTSDYYIWHSLMDFDLADPHCERFCGTMPFFWCIYYFRHTLIHTSMHSSISLMPLPVVLIAFAQYRGVSIGCQAMQDSNPGLPYSRPTHYYLTHAAPSELRLALLSYAAP
jgi:hypothetical protein